jgi:hypothetical protein
MNVLHDMDDLRVSAKSRNQPLDGLLTLVENIAQKIFSSALPQIADVAVCRACVVDAPS